MDFNSHKISAIFLELAGEQRIEILLELSKEASKITQMAKKLNSTVPEVHRNFERLEKSGFIEKTGDGLYHMTTFGKMIMMQIFSVASAFEIQKYFKTHNFDDVPKKFAQRLSVFAKTKTVNGFVRVQDTHKLIYKNANKYVCNILVEASYRPDLLEVLTSKLRSGMILKTIFSENAIVSIDRKEIMENLKLERSKQDEQIKRKMKKNMKISMTFNDSEGCISFPNNDGNVDLSEALYGNDSDFLEWCKDYFDYFWSIANPFNETKLKIDN